MKKSLLITVIACMTFIGANAQTIWNLGGDPVVATNGASAFPVSVGIGEGPFPVVINGLSITGLSTNTNMGAVNASAKTFTDGNNTTYNFVNRFQFNGAGYTGAAATDATPLVFTPTQRYLSFQVSGNSTVYAIGVSGSSSSARNLFVTDGTKLIGTFSYPLSSSAAIYDGTVTYTGPATTLYIYGNSSCNLYYLSATGTVTSVKQVLSDKGITFNGTEIVNTKGLPIEVYSVLGKRVASSVTSIPTANFQKGVYIVRVAGSHDSLKICI